MTVGKTTTKGVGRRRAVPWALLGLWVAVLVLVGPFAAKLADVQHDRATDYLPSSADSTQVARTDLVHAPVWGLVRSAQSENPGRFVLVDVDGGPA
ncbi:hypothetical protein AB0G81_39910, partial [Streptomyces asoensis]|uniref:SpnB-like Rossmann fold domain-containing protein n=1 Tax=Streptomyces asoensis TaxID=249586 RepID=UPI0033ED7563